MKKVFGFVASVLIIPTILIALIFLFSWISSIVELNEGKNLVQKIEQYRLLNKRLPKDKSEIGITNEFEEPPFYRVLSKSNYEVFYNVSIDELMIYSSKYRKWRKSY